MGLINPFRRADIFNLPYHQINPPADPYGNIPGQAPISEFSDYGYGQVATHPAELEDLYAQQDRESRDAFLRQGQDIAPVDSQSPDLDDAAKRHAISERERNLRPQDDWREIKGGEWGPTSWVNPHELPYSQEYIRRFQEETGGFATAEEWQDYISRKEQSMAAQRESGQDDEPNVWDNLLRDRATKQAEEAAYVEQLNPEEQIAHQHRKEQHSVALQRGHEAKQDALLWAGGFYRSELDEQEPFDAFLGTLALPLLGPTSPESQLPSRLKGMLREKYPNLPEQELEAIVEEGVGTAKKINTLTDQAFSGVETIKELRKGEKVVKGLSPRDIRTRRGLRPDPAQMEEKRKNVAKWEADYSAADDQLNNAFDNLEALAKKLQRERGGLEVDGQSISMREYVLSGAQRAFAERDRNANEWMTEEYRPWIEEVLRDTKGEQLGITKDDPRWAKATKPTEDQIKNFLTDQADTMYQAYLGSPFVKHGEFRHTWGVIFKSAMEAYSLGSSLGNFASRWNSDAYGVGINPRTGGNWWSNGVLKAFGRASKKYDFEAGGDAGAFLGDIWRESSSQMLRMTALRRMVGYGWKGFTASVTWGASKEAIDTMYAAEAQGLPADKIKSLGLLMFAAEILPEAALFMGGRGVQAKFFLDPKVLASGYRTAFSRIMMMFKEAPAEVVQEGITTWIQQILRAGFGLDPNADSPEQMAIAQMHSAGVSIAMSILGAGGSTINLLDAGTRAGRERAKEIEWHRAENKKRRQKWSKNLDNDATAWAFFSAFPQEVLELLKLGPEKGVTREAWDLFGPGPGPGPHQLNRKARIDFWNLLRGVVNEADIEAAETVEHQGAVEDAKETQTLETPVVNSATGEQQTVAIPGKNYDDVKDSIEDYKTEDGQQIFEQVEPEEEAPVEPDQLAQDIEEMTTIEERPGVPVEEAPLEEAPVDELDLAQDPVRQEIASRVEDMNAIDAAAALDPTGTLLERVEAEVPIVQPEVPTEAPTEAAEGANLPAILKQSEELRQQAEDSTTDAQWEKLTDQAVELEDQYAKGLRDAVKARVIDVIKSHPETKDTFSDEQLNELVEQDLTSHYFLSGDFFFMFDTLGPGAVRERTSDALINKKETVRALSEDLFRSWARKENLDEEGVFGPLSGWHKKKQAAMVQSFFELANDIHDAIGYEIQDIHTTPTEAAEGTVQMLGGRNSSEVWASPELAAKAREAGYVENEGRTPQEGDTLEDAVGGLVLNEQQQALWKELLPILQSQQKGVPSLIVGDISSLEGGGSANYSPSGHHIRFDPKATKHRMARILLHEAVHAATRNLSVRHTGLTLQARSSEYGDAPEKARQARIKEMGEKSLNAMDRLSAVADWVLKNKPERMEGETAEEYRERTYGVTDTMELIAEAFTNPQFQRWLSTVKVPGSTKYADLRGKTLLQSFIDGVKRLLNIRSKKAVTALEEVLGLSHTIMEEDVYQRQREPQWKKDFRDRRAKEAAEAAARTPEETARLKKEAMDAFLRGDLGAKPHQTPTEATPAEVAAPVTLADQLISMGEKIRRVLTDPEATALPDVFDDFAKVLPEIDREAADEMAKTLGAQTLSELPPETMRALREEFDKFLSTGKAPSETIGRLFTKYRDFLQRASIPHAGEEPSEKVQKKLDQLATVEPVTAPHPEQRDLDDILGELSESEVRSLAEKMKIPDASVMVREELVDAITDRSSTAKFLTKAEEQQKKDDDKAEHQAKEQEALGRIGENITSLLPGNLQFAQGKLKGQARKDLAEAIYDYLYLKAAGGVSTAIEATSDLFTHLKKKLGVKLTLKNIDAITKVLNDELTRVEENLGLVTEKLSEKEKAELEDVSKDNPIAPKYISALYLNDVINEGKTPSHAAWINEMEKSVAGFDDMTEAQKRAMWVEGLLAATYSTTEADPSARQEAKGLTREQIRQRSLLRKALGMRQIAYEKGVRAGKRIGAAEMKDKLTAEYQRRVTAVKDVKEHVALLKRMLKDALKGMPARFKRDLPKELIAFSGKPGISVDPSSTAAAFGGLSLAEVEKINNFKTKQEALDFLADRIWKRLTPAQRRAYRKHTLPKKRAGVGLVVGRTTPAKKAVTGFGTRKDGQPRGTIYGVPITLAVETKQQALTRDFQKKIEEIANLYEKYLTKQSQDNLRKKITKLNSDEHLPFVSEGFAAVLEKIGLDPDIELKPGERDQKLKDIVIRDLFRYSKKKEIREVAAHPTPEQIEILTERALVAKAEVFELPAERVQSLREAANLLKRKHISELTSEEADEISDAITTLLHQEKTHHRLQGLQSARETFRIRTNIRDELLKVLKPQPPTKGVIRRDEPSLASLALRGWGVDLMANPEVFADIMTGGDNTVGYDVLYKKLATATRGVSETTFQDHEFIKEALKQAGFDLSDPEVSAKMRLMSEDTADPISFLGELGKGRVWAAIPYHRSQDIRKGPERQRTTNVIRDTHTLSPKTVRGPGDTRAEVHKVGGKDLEKELSLTPMQRVDLRVKFRDPYWFKLVSVDNKDDPETWVPLTFRRGGENYYLSSEDINGILNHQSDTTDIEVAYADAIWARINGPMAAATSRYMMDTDGVDRTRNNYAPGTRVAPAEKIFSVDPQDFRSAKATVDHMNILKRRTGAAGHPVLIQDGLKMFQNHSHYVANLQHLSGPLAQASAVVNMLDKDLINLKKGGQFSTYYRRLLGDLANEALGGYGRDVHELDTVFKVIANNVTVAGLGFNPRVYLYQVVSLATASTEIEQKYIAMAMAKGQKATMKGSTQQEMDMWSTLRDRMRGRRTGVVSEGYGGSQQSQLLEKKKGFLDMSMYGLTYMDSVAIRTIWEASKEELNTMIKSGESKLTVPKDMYDQPNYWKAVAQRAESIVNRTQPSMDTMHLSELARAGRRTGGPGGSSMARLITMFYAQRSKNMNMMIRAAYDMKRGNKGAAINKFSKVLLYQSAGIGAIREIYNETLRGVAGGLASAVTGQPEEPKDKKTWGERLAAFADFMISSGISNVPLGQYPGYAMRAVVAEFTGHKARVYDPGLSPALAALQEGITSLGATLKNPGTLDNWMKATIAASTIGGVPTHVLRESKRAFTNLTTHTDIIQKRNRELRATIREKTGKSTIDPGDFRELSPDEQKEWLALHRPEGESTVVKEIGRLIAEAKELEKKAEASNSDSWKKDLNRNARRKRERADKLSKKVWEEYLGR